MLIRFRLSRSRSFLMMTRTVVEVACPVRYNTPPLRRRAVATLEGPGYGLVVARCYCGSFMTALDMAVGPVMMTPTPEPQP